MRLLQLTGIESRVAVGEFLADFGEDGGFCGVLVVPGVAGEGGEVCLAEIGVLREAGHHGGRDVILPGDANWPHHSLERDRGEALVGAGDAFPSGQPLCHNLGLST